jgi:hypothetical protein
MSLIEFEKVDYDTILVRDRQRHGQPYADPSTKRREAFSRSICEGWGAQFLPAEAPPEFMER